MKKMREKIVADGLSRIQGSTLFAKRREEIRQEMLHERQIEINSSRWLRRRLILRDIDRAALKKAQGEMCPPGALY